MKTCRKQSHQYEDSKKQCPVCLKATNKLWYEENKAEKLANNKKYEKDRKATDPLFKLRCNVRSLIKMSLKNGGYSKDTKTETILGCTFEELQIHLIQTAIKNYGSYIDLPGTYHIDHKTPLAAAGNDEAKMLQLNHYSNLQLLYPEDNLAKGNKLDWTL